MQRLSVSVIIPSYNGAAKIGRLLTSLQALVDDETEVVLVVDGSTDNTVEVLASYRTLQWLKVVEQANGGRAAARNAGVRQAAGDVLIFFDDDVTPAADSLRRHREFHAHHTGLLAGNPQETPGGDKSDVQNYKAGLTRRWVEKYAPGLQQLHAGNLFFTGANCSCRRAVWQDLQGFDETLRDIEDQDFATRAMARGLDLWFDKDNVVEHHDAVTCVSYIRRLREYRASHAALAQRYPVRYATQAADRGGRRWIYACVAFAALPRWIDQGRLMWLPRPLRYKFYEVVIHALSVVYPAVRL